MKTSAKSKPKESNQKVEAALLVNNNELKIHGANEEEARKMLAQLNLLPATNAAGTILTYNPNSGLHLMHVMEELSQSAKAVNSGDMTRSIAMLENQSHALEAIYTRLSYMAMQQTNVQVMQTLLNLALRAQRQCCITLEAMNELKNPRPVAFVKQANISHGHQQVNNNTRARKKREPRDKLMEAKNGEWLDTRAPGKDGATHPPLETVERLDRPEDAGRKTARLAERGPARLSLRNSDRGDESTAQNPAGIGKTGLED